MVLVVFRSFSSPHFYEHEFRKKKKTESRVTSIGTAGFDAAFLYDLLIVSTHETFLSASQTDLEATVQGLYLT